MFTETNIDAIKQLIRTITDSSTIDFGAGNITWNKAQSKFVLEIKSGGTPYNKYDPFLNNEIRKILHEIKTAISTFGSIIKLTKWRHSARRMTLTFESEVNGKTLEQLNVNRLAERYNIEKYCNQILAIRSYSSSGKASVQRYKIIGIQPKNHRYPIIIEDINRGKRLKANPSFIRTGEIVSPM